MRAQCSRESTRRESRTPTHRREPARRCAQCGGCRGQGSRPQSEAPCRWRNRRARHGSVAPDVDRGAGGISRMRAPGLRVREKAYRSTTITAPFSGVVSERQVSAGRCRSTGHRDVHGCRSVEHEARSIAAGRAARPRSNWCARELHGQWVSRPTNSLDALLVSTRRLIRRLVRCASLLSIPNAEPRARRRVSSRPDDWPANRRCGLIAPLSAVDRPSAAPLPP